MLIEIATHQPQMLVSIVRNTPPWVWGLLAVLLALGLGQLRTREAGLARVLLMPLGMAAYSVYGLASAFGGHPAGTLGAWLLAALLVAGASLLWRPQAPAGVRYYAGQARFHLPGSGVPLLLILGIFFTKYIVGVELALQPALARDTVFTLQVAALYGLFNGVFLARAARLWRLFRDGAVSPSLATA